MFKQLLLFVLIFGWVGINSLLAQSTAVISGYVRDGQTGETLIGATIRSISSSSISTQTNAYGYFSLRLQKGKQPIQIQFLGYQPIQMTINLQKDTILNLKLQAGVELDEVLIDANPRENLVRSPQMGMTKIVMKETQHIPVLFGEKDIIKTLQLLPGVQSGGEGSSQLFVRGGGGDQNLVLLDEAVVYNASHLFGFFSTFNSDALKDVSLYKGAMPAMYGGRVSSVLDIRMLDGNDQKFGFEGGIGLIASRLKLEGPIVKNKGSWMISGRRTYADLFLKLSDDVDVRSSQLYFYDLNLKGNYRINNKNTLFVSGYLGEDILQYSNNFHFSWGNRSGTLRWNHLFHPKLFSNSTVMFSDYKYKIGIQDEQTQFSIHSRIRNSHYKQDFQYFPSVSHTLRFGLQLMSQQIEPLQIRSVDSSSINTSIPDPRMGLDQAVYVSHEWKWNQRVQFDYGLRLGRYVALGPGEYYRFDQEGEMLDKTYYGKGKAAASFWILEPRWSMSYLLHPQKSLKASYSRTSQTVHQLTNTTSSLPTDTWILSSPQVRPQTADQWAIGYAQTFNKQRFSFEFETYYKDMHHQIDLQNGANIQGNQFLEGELVFGKGRAYGAEWLVRKQHGDLTGWMGYTLSKSERKFDAINEGQWFNARQDKTHDFSLVAMYALHKNWHVSATFIYSTGQAVTYPIGKYQWDGQTVYDYSLRNAHRMPSYHRLDIGATYAKPSKKRFQSSWNFGVYNAYNRKNAYIIDFRTEDALNGPTEAYRLALFGIIPSVTYHFKF
jgi:hypothetical protein